MWLLWALAVARADMPLPSYRDTLVRQKWVQVNDEIDHDERDQAIKDATAFEDELGPDATLEYLIGLAYRTSDKPVDAEAHYRRALSMNPDLQEGWYDLGEMMLVAGKYDEAKADFDQVTRLVSTGPQAWIGPWRLAEIAAHEHQPDEFEKQMKLALQRGFSFRTIAGLPDWQRFYADPAMHDSVAKLLTVYGDADTLHSLQTPPEPAPTTP